MLLYLYLHSVGNQSDSSSGFSQVSSGFGLVSIRFHLVIIVSRGFLLALNNRPDILFSFFVSFAFAGNNGINLQTLCTNNLVSDSSGTHA